MTEAHATIIVSVITMFGVVATGVLGYFTHRHARDVNDAVNHRHLKSDHHGNVPPKIYDLAIDSNLRATRVEQKTDELIRWKKGYDNSAFPDSAAIAKFVERVENLEGCNYKPCDACPRKLSE